ncbi:hypothetical protein FRC12_018032 [Ceratobasidium sp. 428]|nr:hypothetical protein FRC12_018032 [Ceratobasidium sp. 428]
MRLLSIVAFVGLVSAASLSSPNLAARKTCDPGEGRISVSSGNCMTCPPGAFGLGGSNMCQACPAGSTSDPRRVGHPARVCRATIERRVAQPQAAHVPSAPLEKLAAVEPRRVRRVGQTPIPFLEDNAPLVQLVIRPPRVMPNVQSSVARLASTLPATRAPPARPINTATPARHHASTVRLAPTRRRDRVVALAAKRVVSGMGAGVIFARPTRIRTGTNPSKRAVQPILDTCSSRPGYQRCPVWSSPGGYECINTLTTLDSCGGCISMPGDKSGSFTGQDCSAIPNVNMVECRRGQCEVASCRKGYAPANGACVAMSHSKAKRGVLMHARHDSF